MPVGEWIGLSRAIRVPITGYFFSFGVQDQPCGWGQGIWYQPNQPTYGTSQFDDQTYRFLLKSKAKANAWDGSLKQMVDIVTEIFSPATVAVTDNNAISLTVTVTGNPPSSLFKFLVTEGYISLKPSGVSVTYSFS